MTEIFFKCTLLSDIVLNSNLATEGNMTTLDYIPGSNFLGIVAGELYRHISYDDAFGIFHTGEVSFGDAFISDDNQLSYQLPFGLMMEKGKENIGKDDVYLHHLLNKDNNPIELQLKQKRNGFINSNGIVQEKIQKTFALKSAQDAEERRSKEGAMFGFESLKARQIFVFSVKFMTDKYIENVTGALSGIKRIGKSKTAQFGQVKIERITENIGRVGIGSNEGYTLVYAQSNLCFLDENSQPTFQPRAVQLGTMIGNINWSKSQIRTYSYSPWNGQRNTINTERHCIAMGSVFYVDAMHAGKEGIVGEYQAEGLGRVIYNPAFLEGDLLTPKSSFFKKKDKIVESVLSDAVIESKTALGKYLMKRQLSKKEELELSKAIQKAIDDSSGELKNVSPSQWGGIRSYASNETAMNSLREVLFDEKTGFLTHGVADERYWGKSRGKLRKEFEIIFKANWKYGTSFIAKYAAEMAKISQKKKEEKNVW